MGVNGVVNLSKLEDARPGDSVLARHDRSERLFVVEVAKATPKWIVDTKNRAFAKPGCGLVGNPHGTRSEGWAVQASPSNIRDYYRQQDERADHQRAAAEFQSEHARRYEEWLLGQVRRIRAFESDEEAAEHLRLIHHIDFENCPLKGL